MAGPTGRRWVAVQSNRYYQRWIATSRDDGKGHVSAGNRIEDVRAAGAGVAAQMPSLRRGLTIGHERIFGVARLSDETPARRLHRSWSEGFVR